MPLLLIASSIIDSIAQQQQLFVVSIIIISSFFGVGRHITTASAFVINAGDGGDERDEIGYESLVPYQLYTRYSTIIIFT
jgi:hypothetical protein